MPYCPRRVEEEHFTLSGLGNKWGWGWGVGRVGGSWELLAHKERTELDPRGLSGAPPGRE